MINRFVANQLTEWGIKEVFSFRSCNVFKTVCSFKKEHHMNRKYLLIASGIFFSYMANGADTKNWTAQSTESQFGQQITPIQISSSNSADIAAMQKSATSNDGTNKKSISLVKTMMARPNVADINQEFWIFDAWLTMHQDRDHDGYFHHFTIELDADTEYASATVYARLYLGIDEVFQEFHSTANFNIYSDNSDDSYVIETELLNGFPSNDYEVLIELYDAYSDELVAVYDGYNDADLYLISLESKNYDSQQVVVVHEHGGSLGVWGLLLLPLLMLLRFSRAD